MTKEDNPKYHFALFFVACDLYRGEVFIGKHRKSGLWLVNGGHVEKGELPIDTLKREAAEEWGYIPFDYKVIKPFLLTLTFIDNPEKQSCRRHFDVWYLIKVKRSGFNPHPGKLRVEFSRIGWKRISEARKLKIPPAVDKALEYIQGSLSEMP